MPVLAEPVSILYGLLYRTTTGLLEPWEELAHKYRNGEISREEYNQWRYNDPKSEAERNEEALRNTKEEI